MVGVGCAPIEHNQGGLSDHLDLRDSGVKESQ